MISETYHGATIATQIAQYGIAARWKLGKIMYTAPPGCRYVGW
jgi:hypothetical protein